MEEFKKEVVEKLKRNLSDLEKEMTSHFTVALCDLSVITTIDEVMKIKKTLLLSILGSMPTDGMYCYFCCYGKGCKNCSYAKAHVRCNDDKSTWRQMMIKIKGLGEFIRKEYWTGEELKKEVVKDEKK